MSDPTPDPPTAAEYEELPAELAAYFAARLRRGERPTVEEYVLPHPTLAEKIRQALPAITLIEESRPLDSLVAGEQPGSLAGRYKLLQRIGEGGFGTVFMAEQQV